jgi:hypothetical protein
MTDINYLKKTIMNRISSQVNTVQDVSDYDKIVFSGFPAVTVTVASNDNEFWSTGENQRAFNFVLDIYVQISKKVEQGDDNQRQAAERIMGNAVSDIIDAFDSYTEFGGDAEFLRAAPSTWDYIETSEGFMRHAKINLQVVKMFTI